MTPEQVVVRLRSDCTRLDDRPGWCVIHESRWAFKVYRHCDAMTDDIDLAEQVAEAARADERERIAQAIEAMPCAYPDDYAPHTPTVWQHEAARIARDGGRDD